MQNLTFKEVIYLIFHSYTLDMLNFIWAGFILTAIVTSFFTGKIEAVSSAALSGAMEGVNLCFEMAGVMCFWTGLMAVAEKSGLIRIFAKILRPVTRFLFPDIKKDSPAMDSIVMNISANMLGMSNAATPLGLRAMSELDKLQNRKKASNAMCMFAIINTASVQILPSTVIALRAAAGSAAPSEIIVPVWIVSVISLLVAVISAKYFEKRG